MKYETPWTSYSKIILWISIAHLYMVLCGMIYHVLESPNAAELRLDAVEKFLSDTLKRKDVATLQNRHSSNFRKLMQEYRDAAKEEEYWVERNQFRDMAKSYIFVLMTHTTLGNSGMRLNTWQSRLFFVFTAPIGFIFYYLMLHFISVEFVAILNHSSVAIFPELHENWTSERQNLFINFKMAAIPFFFSLLVILLLALLSLVTGHSYLTGLHFVTDTIITAGSTKYVGELVVWESTSTAISLTLILLLVLVFFYTTMYTTINAFWGQNWSEIYTVLCTGHDLEQGYSPLPPDESINQSELSQMKTMAYLYQSGLYADPVVMRDKCNQTHFRENDSSDSSVSPVEKSSTKDTSNERAGLGVPQREISTEWSSASSREVTPFETSDEEANAFDTEKPLKSALKKRDRPSPFQLDLKEVSKRLEEHENLPKIQITVPTPSVEKTTILFPSRASRDETIVEDSQETTSTDWNDSKPTKSTSDTSSSVHPESAPEDEKVPSTLNPKPSYLEDYDNIDSDAGAYTEPMPRRRAVKQDTLEAADSKDSLTSNFSNISMSDLAKM